MLPDFCRNAFRHKELRTKAAKCQEINHYLRSQRDTVRKQPYALDFLERRSHFHESPSAESGEGICLVRQVLGM